MSCLRLVVFLVVLCSLVSAQANEYNPIYRGEVGEIFSKQPNAFLVEILRNRKPGAALDVGMGQGRNAIYLAQQGWEVTGIDSADEGVKHANREAARLGLRLHTQVTSFEQFDFGEAKWDLIVLLYEPTKSIAPRVTRALKPGGLVLIEDRHLDTRRVWPAGAFADNELPKLFPELRVLRYEDVWAKPDWSAKGLEERLVRLAAEKPMPKPTGCLWEAKSIEVGAKVCWDSVILHCNEEGWTFTRDKCKP
ncbi:class I SAM-dependent methyltransferase [Bryobacter aggregatus]|uniref:class I SAM-dependent methyltransferase n=1 Tax=Bryobacter aggregatus TaxID=360054 RepID=UPI00068F2544|nr:class I SAM-dependent methyltransferase [Bryobacter aggregatus]